MNVKVFVDTNILVYNRDSSEPAKQKLAHHWLTILWENRNGRLSYQVLNEYYITVTQKLSPGLDILEARQDVRNLTVWKPVPIDDRVVTGAWSIQDRYHFSWWDCLIISAAQIAGCIYLISEDLQHGQQVDELQIINPFLLDPANLNQHNKHK